jgi:hypothetical protein
MLRSRIRIILVELGSLCAAASAPTPDIVIVLNQKKDKIILIGLVFAVLRVPYPCP